MLEELRQIQQASDRTLSEIRKMQAGSTNHNIMMQSPDSGERAAHKASMIAAVLGALLVGLLIGGWGLIGRMADDARDLKRTQDRYNDYQAMLWQRYPELRPENLKPKPEASKP
jgi:hypothetical protein